MRRADETLRQAYLAAMECAREKQAATVGLPLISSGIFRGHRSLADIVGIALRAVEDGAYSGLQEAHLIAHHADEIQALEGAARRLWRPGAPATPPGPPPAPPPPPPSPPQQQRLLQDPGAQAQARPPKPRPQTEQTPMREAATAADADGAVAQPAAFDTDPWEAWAVEYARRQAEENQQRPAAEPTEEQEEQDAPPSGQAQQQRSPCVTAPPRPASRP